MSFYLQLSKTVSLHFFEFCPVLLRPPTGNVSVRKEKQQEILMCKMYKLNPVMFLNVPKCQTKTSLQRFLLQTFLVPEAWLELGGNPITVP